jgi:hypothetical protein
MAKERLDLMVDSVMKKMLKEVAAREGISMSQLVENMLIEHLSDEGNPENPMHAVVDMLWLQRLHSEFEEAMGAGTIYSFRTYCKLAALGELPDTDAPIVLYVGEPEGKFERDDFVLDRCVDEIHDDIISTYDSVLHTVSVRMGWAEGDDGTLEPYDLRIWPKGRANGFDSLFDWECKTEWSGMATYNPYESQ